ncbi:MAG: response regulator [Spirochaetaceae bacterium]|jgi:signal transduction histidine kinase/CheY-like chemotaxis protein/CHASE3 domain sensor protein|nr:response regulator [Spirochaetaceae bacterium]
MNKIRWTVGRKISLGFLLGTTVTLVVGIMGFMSVQTLSGALKAMEEIYTPRSAALEDLNSLRLSIRLTIFDALGLQTEKDAAENLERIQGERREIFEEVDAVWQKLQSIPFTNRENTSMFSLLGNEYVFWRIAHRMLDEYLSQIAAAEDESQKMMLYREFAGMVEQTTLVSISFSETMSNVRQRNAEIIEQIVNENSRQSLETKLRLICFILIGIIFAGILTIIITNHITSPVRHALSLLTAMSKGEHIEEIKIDSEDEIGEIINLLQNEIAAKLKAEDTSRSKVEFLAMVSHEIRTPLNAILGLTEVQLQNHFSRRLELPPGTINAFAKIKESGKGLLSIVNGVLDISKIEMGKLEFNPRNYDFAHLLNDTLIPYYEVSKTRGIEFKIEIDEDVPAVLYGDPARISQILGNLLSNAFKFTETGCVTFKITTFKLGNGLFVTFTVRDTGIGIKKADLETVFSEFYQLDRGTERKAAGVGLGLAVSQRLAVHMGGVITCQSDFGKGTVFSFQLPQRLGDGGNINKDIIAKLRQLSPLETPAKTFGSNSARGRALIVDDIETNIEVARGILSLYNIDSDGALSGIEALKIIEKGEPRYDMIFMDHMKPDMNGLEATSLIRALDSDYAKNIPVIALTANTMAGGENKFLNSGFNAYMAKPLDIEKLDLEMAKLGRHRAAPIQLDLYEETSVFNDLSIKGMNFSDGLRRFGSVEMYKHILFSFVHNTPAVLEKIKAIAASGALTAAKTGDYSILAHGIKGSARAIGAELVGNMAEELEKAAKAGDTALILEKNLAFAAETEKLIDSLAEFERAENAEKETEKEKEIKEKPDEAALKRLAAACDDYELSEADALLRELERYNYTGDGGLIRYIREQIDNYDFSAVSKKIYASL